jgi:tRNA(Met) cytidine acetyltransferase
LNRRVRCRHLIVLRGSPEETAAAAQASLAQRGPTPGDDLWVGEGGIAHGRVRTLLGRAFDAVVLDLHDDLDADVLGQVHGFVRGGGALVLRLPPADAPPGQRGQERLAAFPYSAADVGTRYRHHLERAIARAEVSAPHALGPADHDVAGTAEQAAVVDQLASRLAAPDPSVTTVVADRGRGKSSALGLALALVRARAANAVVTAQDPGSAAEVFQFALGRRDPPLTGPVRFVPPTALATGDVDGNAAVDVDIIVVDEAAQLPVPVLQRIVHRHPKARVAFATTARGYEGTGRGFMLRFLAWLASDPRPHTHLTLEAPIRWAPGDPVERFVFDALMLDAQPAPLDPAAADEPLEHAHLDRDALVADERTLADVFGLLVHAHYRTTPEDLHRILDAPNLALHVLRTRTSRRVVAVNLVAHEGGLPLALCRDVARGRHRLRAHALPDTLVAHLGRPEAGALRMLRSVRIASHPDMRRRHVASRLIEAVQRTFDGDLVGTVFGATAELLAFRRSLGYEVVRVSASHGARTGEPAVMMIRPSSPAARALHDALRAELARDLPLQLALHEADGELLLDPGLDHALRAGLPAAAPLADGPRDAVVASYLAGPRTFESVAAALTAFVAAHPEALRRLDPQHAALLTARVLDRRSWTRAAGAAGYPSVRAAMRAFRRAVHALTLEAAPHLLPGDDTA